MMEQIKRPIGLTGGIGTGKSTVSAYFAKLGAAVLDADEISRSLLMPGGACVEKTIDLFGKGIVRSDGSIDRALIASIIFSDESKRSALNELIHPYVLKELESRAEELFISEPERLIVYDVPLLYECGFERWCRATILVTAPREKVIERVMERDSAGREQVTARMRAQMPECEKRLRADYIIENDSTLEALFEKVFRLFALLTGGGR